jgi:hypothetical protein
LIAIGDKVFDGPLELWIEKGRLVQKPPSEGGQAIPERVLFERMQLVRMNVDKSGVTLRWHMLAANWSSLYFAKELIATFPGPYRFEYYVAGWFSETLQHPADAVDRLDELIHKSDVHLSSSVYIRDGDVGREDMPRLLRSALRANYAQEDDSIDCIMDPASGRYRVQRVGSRSTIARLWGMSPISYPCLTGHTYDQVVSKIYPEVSRSGEPHYDHICAAMTTATGETMWIPYQRVVLPLRDTRAKKAVRIVTELAKVDVSPL